MTGPIVVGEFDGKPQDWDGFVRTHEGTACHLWGWRAVMRDMTGRTRSLFSAGRRVCDGVSGRLRWELRLTWLGGSRILDKLERADFDVFTARPTVGAWDVPGLLRDAVLWR